MARVQLPAFPIDGPVLPERRQIGRREAIDRLEARVVEQANHQWLIGPRRIGKTSVAKAVADRLRNAGHVALEIDLSRANVHDAPSLATALVGQARAAGIGAGTRRSLRDRITSVAAPTANVLDAFEEGETGRAVEGVAALLGAAEEGQSDLDEVVRLLAVEPGIANRRTMVLLDEVHVLREIGCEQAIANGARSQQQGLVFVFAGSEESAVRDLRTDGPLAKVGQQFRVPEISTAAWRSGLAERFREIDVGVEETQLFEILDASDNHPRRTMLICSCLQSLCHRGQRADAVAVREAIEQARGDLSWT